MKPEADLYPEWQPPCPKEEQAAELWLKENSKEGLDERHGSAH